MPVRQVQANGNGGRLVGALALFICCLMLITGCQGNSQPSLAPEKTTLAAVSETPEAAINAPTLAPFFVSQENTPTPQPTSPPLPTQAPPIEENIPETKTTSISIYSNGLNPDWEIVQNTEVLVTETGRPNTYEGRLALQVTPLQDFGQFFIRLKPEAKHFYPRSKVLALVLWVSGGPNYIDTDDLAVTVIGSNDFRYWVADDRSVFDGPDSPFSETRLYYLGLSDAIPPNSWAEVVNWLNDREFDPEYRYVTGFYIKNDEGFEVPYYIDEISLMVIDDQPEPFEFQDSPPKPILPQ